MQKLFQDQPKVTQFKKPMDKYIKVAEDYIE